MDAQDILNVVAKHDAALANKIRNKMREERKREQYADVLSKIDQAEKLMTEAYRLHQKTVPGGVHDEMLGAISTRRYQLQVTRGRYRTTITQKG